MKSIKDSLAELLQNEEFDTAYEMIEKNLKSEIDYIKVDPEYCVIVANTYLAMEKLARAFDFIAIGLINDNRNYELYLLLGEYYGRNNANQALLCFYQALFYCDVPEDRVVIEEYIKDIVEQGAEVRQISIVIVARNQSRYLKNCLESIIDTVCPGMYEIVVIDDASTDGTVEWLSEFEGISYYSNEERIGYTRSANIGIKLANAFNDILLLDAAVMALDNSIFYLMLGMYYDDNIGVIGGNATEYIGGQKIDIDILDIQEVDSLAQNVNSPLMNSLEKSVFVKDSAMLISRKAIDKVGILDECFDYGVFEDCDFGIRVNRAGLSVNLCYNSYFLNFMDRSEIYSEQDTQKYKDLFIGNWGCSIDYYNTSRDSLIELIDANEDERIEVLELGCAMGSTLNKIKRLWPDAVVHGIEYSQQAASIGAYITDIIQGDVENMDIPYAKEQFDYIICADVLEHLRDPEATLKRFLPYLKKSGKVIISIPNVRHYAVITMLVLAGRFDYGDSGILDRTHIKFFTKDTAIEMINSAGLKVMDIRRNYNGECKSNEFIETLSRTFTVTDPEELMVFQYYFVAEK